MKQYTPVLLAPYNMYFVYMYMSAIFHAQYIYLVIRARRFLDYVLHFLQTFWDNTLRCFVFQRFALKVNDIRFIYVLYHRNL
jgi:hypothetical protein